MFRHPQRAWSHDPTRVLPESLRNILRPAFHAKPLSKSVTEFRIAEKYLFMIYNTLQHAASSYTGF